MLLATKMNQPACLELLLLNGFNKDTEDDVRCRIVFDTVFWLMLVYQDDDEGSTATMHAARLGHVACLKLLLQHGADYLQWNEVRKKILQRYHLGSSVC